MCFEDQVILNVSHYGNLRENYRDLKRSFSGSLNLNKVEAARRDWYSNKMKDKLLIFSVILILGQYLQSHGI